MYKEDLVHGTVATIPALDASPTIEVESAVINLAI
jgi:hypothetical protein